MSELDLAVVVGANITLKRKTLGLSQKELAVKLDITQESMGRIEKGKIAPKMGRLQEIATVLNCSVASLFYEYNADIQEKAMVLAEALQGLSREQQETVMTVFLATVSAMQKNNG